jgi:hypothetical protein
VQTLVIKTIVLIRGHNKQVAICKARKKAFTRTHPYCHLGFELPASRTVRDKCILFTPLSLWCFASAAQAKEHRLFPGDKNPHSI